MDKSLQRAIRQNSRNLLGLARTIHVLCKGIVERSPGYWINEETGRRVPNPNKKEKAPAARRAASSNKTDAPPPRQEKKPVTKKPAAKQETSSKTEAQEAPPKKKASKGNSVGRALQSLYHSATDLHRQGELTEDSLRERVGSLFTDMSKAEYEEALTVFEINRKPKSRKDAIDLAVGKIQRRVDSFDRAPL